MIIAIVFLVSAAVVVIAGARLSREGDVLAARTRLGAAFIGAVAVASATSLPELATTSFAVVQGSVGLALGDLFGTLMVNMAMLALAVVLIRGPNIFQAAPDDSAIPAVVTIALCGIAVVGMVAAPTLGPLGLGWASIAIGLAYGGGLWIMRRDRAKRGRSGARSGGGASRSVRPTLLRFGIASAAIVAAAYALALSARALAEQLGLSESFFGTALLGVVTSLPEATVAFTAFRREAYGIGIGALFGSNAFDVVIVLPLDAIHRPGPILAEAEPGTVVSAVFAMVLMAMALTGVVARGDRRIRGVEPLAIAMLVVYAFGIVLVYRAGAG